MHGWLHSVCVAVSVCMRVHQCVCLPTFDKEASGEGEMEGKVVIY